MIMEKAWAKLNGSYARVEGGHISTALSALNGLPSKTYWHKDDKFGVEKVEGGFA